MAELFRAPLTEQYQPKSWADVVGQEKIVNRLLALRQRGLAGRAYWLSGQSGTGKTTLARLIAADVADDFMVQEVDAAGLTVAALRELERDSQIAGWGAKAGRAFIVNEYSPPQQSTARNPRLHRLLPGAASGSRSSGRHRSDGCGHRPFGGRR